MEPFFGDLYDINFDGKMDKFEEYVDFMAYMKLVEEQNRIFEEKQKEKQRERKRLDKINNWGQEKSSNWRLDKINELKARGLNVYELGSMEWNERAEALREAGFNPVEYEMLWRADE